MLKDGSETALGQRRSNKHPNTFGIVEGGIRLNGSVRYDEWVCERCHKRNFNSGKENRLRHRKANEHSKAT